jgi:hypothetical protein
MRGREELTEQKQVHAVELHSLYCPQNVIREEGELDGACAGKLQAQRVPGACGSLNFKTVGN